MIPPRFCCSIRYKVFFKFTLFHIFRVKQQRVAKLKLPFTIEDVRLEFSIIQSLTNVIESFLFNHLTVAEDNPHE